MFDDKSILAIIPARGGSKGVPRKNLRMVAGKPLIVWTIEQALKSQRVDRTILSSDDDEIIEVAREAGCEVPFVRPAELSGDEVSGMSPVLHALSEVPGYDVVVLLQPTSPLRSSNDIDGCIEAMISNGRPSCVSVMEADPNPFLIFRRMNDGTLEPILSTSERPVRRQDMPAFYSLNGAVYAAHVDWLNKKKTFLTEETIGFVMPRSRSLDIDTEFDLRIANLCLESRDEAISNTR